MSNKAKYFVMGEVDEQRTRKPDLIQTYRLAWLTCSIETYRIFYSEQYVSIWFPEIAAHSLNKFAPHPTRRQTHWQTNNQHDLCSKIQ